MIFMGRRYLGYYYVTKEKIYLRFVEGMDGYTTDKDKKLWKNCKQMKSLFKKIVL